VVGWSWYQRACWNCTQRPLLRYHCSQAVVFVRCARDDIIRHINITRYFRRWDIVMLKHFSIWDEQRVHQWTCNNASLAGRYTLGIERPRAKFACPRYDCVDQCRIESWGCCHVQQGFYARADVGRHIGIARRSCRKDIVVLKRFSLYKKYLLC
jgi:hypothetical protein